MHQCLQITDAYRLVLAVDYGGRLVTFERGIAVEPVYGAAKNILHAQGRP